MSTSRTTKCAVAIAGSVDSGKSSFVGVLVSGKLDDGNGSARVLIATHPHEIATKKTSDVASPTFDIPDKNEAITLLDLCGHEDYLKTTTYGVSGYFPDYAFLIVSANRGVLTMTKQHMRLLLSLSIPIMIIITHIDIAPVEIYELTKKQIKQLCEFYVGKTAVVQYFQNPIVGSESKGLDVSNIIESLTNIPNDKQKVFPVVSVSNTTGVGIDVIKKILYEITPRQFWSSSTIHNSNSKISKLYRAGLEKQKIDLDNIPQHTPFSGSVFYCNGSYNPPGIGIVVVGISRGHQININDTMYIGPFGQTFHQVRIRSMHNNARQNIQTMDHHTRGCLAIVSKKDDFQKHQIDKGFVVLSSLELTKFVCWRFKAVITLFTKSITLKSGYSPVVHMANIQQSVRMIIDPKDNDGNDVIVYDGSALSTSTVAVVTFKFKCHPEFIEPYTLFVLRSGNIQGIGLVISTVPISEDDDAKPDPQKDPMRGSKRQQRKTGKS